MLQGDQRVSIGRLAAIVALSFGLTLVTSTLEPALIGNRILAVAPPGAAYAPLFGAVTFGGLLIAIVTQPIAGAWSDRVHTRLGRRLPFMFAGSSAIVAGLIVIVVAPSLLALIAGLLVTQFGVNVTLAGWQPAIAEQASHAQRGLLSGIKAGFDLGAAIVGRLAAGELISRAAAWGDLALWAAIGLPIAGLLATLAITVAAIYPRSSDAEAERAARSIESSESLWDVLRRSFTVDVRAHPAFAWWFANRVLFWAGVIASSVFLLFVAMDMFGMSEAEAQRYISRVIVVLGLALAVVILPAGWLTDRIGRRPMVILAGLLASAGAALIVFEQAAVIPAAVLIGAGTGIYLSSSLALIGDIVPAGEAARYLGVANIATAGGSALARLGGGATIGWLNAATDSSVTGYLALYAVASVLFLVSAIVMAFAPRASLVRTTNSPNRARASATARD